MLRPCGPRVLVRPDALEESDQIYAAAKKVGIQLPDLIGEKNAVVRGTVLSCGETCWQAPVGNGTPWCLPGDRIYFAKYSGARVTENGQDYLLLNDEDIVAVIEEKIDD